ncbi:MAG: SDR family oxidoreductase [Calditrichaceae bacterium]
MTKLKNKIVLITGATSGIGEACARAFAKEGSNLILTGRRGDRLEKLSKELQKNHNINCFLLSFDIRDKSKVSEKISSLPEEWQSIDILINNAGLARGVSKVFEMTAEDYDEVIDTNVKGLLYITRAVVPGMIKRNKGHVVNLGSIAGHEVYPGGNVYCATKHAVDALTKALRIELVETPIRVSTVDPGLVETEFSMVRFRGDKDKAESVYKNLTPLRGDDIADVIIFITSRPAHVQIAEVIVFPTDQASSSVLHRNS